MDTALKTSGCAPEPQLRLTALGAAFLRAGSTNVGLGKEWNRVGTCLCF